MTDPRVVAALDFAAAKDALDMARRLDPVLCRVKVGKELFTAAGPSLVEALSARGFGVFLDLKFHDIPNTVASACRAATQLGVWMVNVHASGGRTMLDAAREAIGSGAQRPKIVAVTVLTSLADADLEAIGMRGPVEDAVLRLARLAQLSGLDGVVCSAQEASTLRAACGSGFCLVTPGIRLAEGNADDQKRVTTPLTAVANGADYLVIGRPITRAVDPVAVLRKINEEIGQAR